MNISQLSRTAILTLIARLVASERENAAYNDPMAVLCFERLLTIVSEEDRRWITREKRIFSGMQAHHAIAGAQRARVFDTAADRFIAAQPHCTVINLACGLDTRFWRINHQNCRYIELDLPEIVALKSEILHDRLAYELLACSVLDPSWIDQVTANGSSRFLLLAEGLFSYLPEADTRQLFQRLAHRFDRSQIVLDIVPHKYTRGIWKKLIGLETRYTWGVDISWVSGLKDPRDLETYAPGLKVLGAVKASGGPFISVSINSRPATPK